mmetsp:Transcript_3489/g.11842  ORF Transcript_3489/g.11842 Transcript_3489/m.11842 type:complete len:204 (+) Transcript_3489:10996-11607(+)
MRGLAVVQLRCTAIPRPYFSYPILSGIIRLWAGFFAKHLPHGLTGRTFHMLAALLQHGLRQGSNCGVLPRTHATDVITIENLYLRSVWYRIYSAFHENKIRRGPPQDLSRSKANLLRVVRRDAHVCFVVESVLCSDASRALRAVFTFFVAFAVTLVDFTLLISAVMIVAERDVHPLSRGGGYCGFKTRIFEIRATHEKMLLRG